nr:hypothetical protein Itr_chr09CG13420 [Ipomoea trifida]
MLAFPQIRNTCGRQVGNQSGMWPLGNRRAEGGGATGGVGCGRQRCWPAVTASGDSGWAMAVRKLGRWAELGGGLAVGGGEANHRTESRSQR